MATKKFEGAPFGSQAARFDVSAIYPTCKKKGSYTQVPYCKNANSYEERRLGPGTYNVTQGDFIPCNLKKKASGPGWKRAEETEKLTEMPHLLYREMWMKQRFLKENMGPGRYNIKDFLELGLMKPGSSRGACETREPRFKESAQFATPGPGAYGKKGNPYALLEEKERQCGVCRGIMGSKTTRGLPYPGMASNLGPGTYNVRNYIDDLLNRVVSIRGPYDLFTGERTTIASGHFATLKGNNLELGTANVRSFLEDLNSPEKRKHGVFGPISEHPHVPTERICNCTLAQCPRKPDAPGPASYEAKPASAPVSGRGHPPFNSSARRFENRLCSLFFTSDNPVGIGRYDITVKQHGETSSTYRSAFLGKTGRYLDNAAHDKQLQERTKATNISRRKKGSPDAITASHLPPSIQPSPITLSTSPTIELPSN
ncbi:ciliary microtubule-associated protein 2 [Lissotriton helveticus]